jgi:hypothetical protein
VFLKARARSFMYFCAIGAKAQCRRKKSLARFFLADRIFAVGVCVALPKLAIKLAV